MTLTQGTEGPEISFYPTAPPLSNVTIAPIDNYASVATATAIPIVSATAVPDTPTLLESSPDRTDIERTTNSDGSLCVKVTRITTQDYGYHHVRIEHYMIPASVANSEMQSMDITGMAPSSVYMTKIENHRVPPGVNVGEALSSPSPPAYATPTIPQGGGGATIATTPMGMTDYERNRRKRFACFFIVMIAVVVWTIVKVSSIISRETMTRYSPPSPSYSYDDNFFNPSYPTPSYSHPVYLDDNRTSRITMSPTLSAS